MRTTLNRTDFQTIAWELRKLAIFFPEPVKVELGNWQAMIGNGFGGLSETFTQRGEDCILGCGGCCTQVKWNLLTWYESEPHPTGCIPIDLKFNGKPMRLWGWPYNSLVKCEFRDDSPLKACTIHGTTRAIMCHFGPQMGLYQNPKNKRYYLSRRIVSRNWRWPRCPINVAEQPFTNKTFKENDLIISTFGEALSDIDREAYMRAVNLRSLLCISPYEDKGRIEIEKIPTTYVVEVITQPRLF